jgi:hypothetical protein
MYKLDDIAKDIIITLLQEQNHDSRNSEKRQKNQELDKSS